MLLEQVFLGGGGGSASLAEVSYSSGGVWGAVSDQEYRHRPMVSPGGYRWCPGEEDRVLLLHTGDGDLCAGAADSGGLAPGEVEITGPGGSAIRLLADGVMRLSGPGGSFLELRADGSVAINGTVIPAVSE